jgi:hypothetical protein
MTFFPKLKYNPIHKKKNHSRIIQLEYKIDWHFLIKGYKCVC